MEHLPAIIGYLASVLLMVGLLVTTDLKFRIWNGLGCLFFIIYALLIKAPPVLLTNAVLLAINIFYFIKIIRRKETFDATIVSADDVLVSKFLEFYSKDIAEYFPKFTKSDLIGNVNIVVLRDLVIANICSFKIENDGRAEVILNYTHPRYRDFKVGRYLFNKDSTFLKDLGIQEVYYTEVYKKSHGQFLKRSGFTPSGNGQAKKL